MLLAHKPALEDLEDLLQEVALTLVTKVGTLREDTNLRAWLRTVAINAARAAGRRSRHRAGRELDERDLDGDGAGIAAALAGNELIRHTLRRVEQLPETYREPLLLRTVHGLRSRQIAEILEVTPATVDTRIARARRLLRETAGAAAPEGGSVAVDAIARGCEDPMSSEREVT